MIAGITKGWVVEPYKLHIPQHPSLKPPSREHNQKQISAKVPGSTAETCKAMANQIALDKARGTKKNFFGGYVEVKETEMKVDYDATPMNRIKEAFGFKK